MSDWRQAAIAPAILAVNLSLKQLQAGEGFVGAVTETLTKWALSPKDLELDVTESMLAHVTLHKTDVLDRLQKFGVKIAIDDFGTQDSSLDYLKTYCVSRVKIPRSMIDSATRDPEASAMVRAIIGLGRELGVEVVAQGVETEQHRELLSCAPSPAKVQGFYYSAPVPALEATELLRQRFVEPRLNSSFPWRPRAIGEFDRLRASRLVFVSIRSETCHGLRCSAGASDALSNRQNRGRELMALCPLVGKRMTEATGVEAKTTRRLLEVDPKGGGFKQR